MATAIHCLKFRLPTEDIAILITVNWFLDRCRTAINVIVDMTVSAVIDGKYPQVQGIVVAKTD
jgi:Na+/H+-dicarboxylate symporter